MDLGASLWGPEPVGARRLWSLLNGLPVDSALSRKLDPSGGRWGQLEELIAVLIEVTDMGNRMYLKAHVKEGVNVGDPIHIPRPWDPEPELRILESGDMKGFFGPSEVKFMGGE